MVKLICFPYTISKSLLVIMSLCLNYIITQSSDNERIARMNACTHLAKHRVYQDMNYISSIASFINPDGSQEENFNQLLSMGILSCYKNISQEEADDLGAKVLLDNQVKFDLDIMNDKYKSMLNFERWEEVYRSNDENLLKSELMSHSGALNDLRKMKEIENHQKDNSKLIDDDDFSTEGENYYNYNGRDLQQDLSLFGYKIQDLPWEIKAVFGICFLIGVVTAIFIGLKKAAVEPKKKKDRSKKNK